MLISKLLFLIGQKKRYICNSILIGMRKWKITIYLIYLLGVSWEQTSCA